MALVSPLVKHIGCVKLFIVDCAELPVMGHQISFEIYEPVGTQVFSIVEEFAFPDDLHVFSAFKAEMMSFITAIQINIYSALPIVLIIASKAPFPHIVHTSIASIGLFVISLQSLVLLRS
jgi:hypothetical protein